MASKTISVTDDVHELLGSLKPPHESFGDVIRRLCSEKTAISIVRWAEQGTLWSDMTESELQEIQTNVLDTKRHFHVYEGDFD